MADPREDILARLVELVATLPNIKTAYRNNARLGEDVGKYRAGVPQPQPAPAQA